MAQPGNVISTLLPVSGTGTSDDPITLPQPDNGQYNWYFNSQLKQWGLYVNPSPTVVTVGPSEYGAMYRTIEEAFRDECYYVRIVGSKILSYVTQPGFTFPQVGGNCYIYIDIGAVLTFTGPVDWNGSIVSIVGGSVSGSILVCDGPPGRYMLNYNTLNIDNCRIGIYDPNITLNCGKRSTNTIINNCELYTGEGAIITSNGDNVTITNIAIKSPGAANTVFRIEGTPGRVLLSDITVISDVEQIIEISAENVVLSRVTSSYKSLTINVNASKCYFDHLINLKALNLSTIGICNDCTFSNVKCDTFTIGTFGCVECVFTNLKCSDLTIYNADTCSFSDLICSNDFKISSELQRCLINGLTIYKNFLSFTATESTISNLMMVSKIDSTVFTLSNMSRCILDSINVCRNGSLSLLNVSDCSVSGINMATSNSKLYLGKTAAVTNTVLSGITVANIEVNICNALSIHGFNCSYITDSTLATNCQLCNGVITGPSGIAFSSPWWIISACRVLTGPVVIDGNNVTTTACTVGQKSSQTIISLFNGTLVAGCRTGTPLVNPDPKSAANSLII